MRIFTTCLIAVTVCALAGCAVMTRDSPAEPVDFQSVDGLDRVKIDLPGVLELRKNHGIGSYDALLIRKARISYKRDSLRLTRTARQIFLTLLTDTLVEASTAASVPIATRRGPCVMEINLDVVAMNLALEDDPEQLAEMILVMQFLDSSSEEPLLRYAVPNRVPNPAEGISHNDQLKRGLNRTIKEMDLAGPLRGAGLADDEIKPGCNGTLAAIGRAAQQGR